MPGPRLLARCAFTHALLVAVLAVAACGTDAQSVGFSLGADVQVIRDEWGVPHIYAHGAGNDSSDALFALGYETARDRLFQLDYTRRRAEGRVAEWLGESAADDDILARTIGFGRLGEIGADDLRANDPDVYRSLEGYSAGISAYIADAAAARNGAVFPPEFADIDPDYRPEPWRVADSLALIKGEMFLLAAHPETDLTAFAAAALDAPGVSLDVFRPDPLEDVYVTDGFPPAGAKPTPALRSAPSATLRPPPGAARPLAALAEAFAHLAGRHRIGPTGASNNWVVCGAKTASGATMLANDPHLELALPTNLYEFHLEDDDPTGGLRIAGYGFPGMPAVAIGHNAAGAWGVTTVEADVSDSYLETTDGDTVQLNGQSVPMEVRTEIIRVRRDGGRLTDFDEIQHKVRVVPHHGPVVSDTSPELALVLGADKAVSFRWLGLDVTHEPRAFYDLMRAQSFEDFKAALNHFEAGLFNFVYAGTDGDIGYYPHSAYPIRDQVDPANPPYGVLPGTGDYEWTGALIPNDRIPQLHNPAACRIFTANNDPVGTTADGDALNDAFYFGGTFDYGLRARRIRDRLDALDAGGIKLSDLESMQRDVHSGIAEHFLPPLLEAADGAALTPAAAELLAALTDWDREDTVGSVAATVFNAFYSQLLVDVFADDLGLVFSTAIGDDRSMSPVLEHALRGEPLPSGHDYLGGKTPAEVLLATLEEVAVSLPAALGEDRSAWAWGKVHTLTFRHPLGEKYQLGPVALGGGLSSLNAARYAPGHDGAPVIRPEVFEGPNTRVVVELLPGNVTMRSILPTGESGLPGDPHYQDQLDMWLAGQTRESHFAREDVTAHAARTASLPKGFPQSGAPR